MIGRIVLYALIVTDLVFVVLMVAMLVYIDVGMVSVLAFFIFLLICLGLNNCYKHITELVWLQKRGR